MPTVLVLPCSQGHHGIQQHARQPSVAKVVHHGRLMENRMVPVMDVRKVLLQQILAKLWTCRRSLTLQRIARLITVVVGG